MLDQEKNIRLDKKESLHPRGWCRPLRDEDLGPNTGEMTKTWRGR